MSRTKRHSLRFTTIIIIQATLLPMGFVSAQAPEEGYMMPPKAIADLVDAPWTPRVSLSPDNEWMLLMQYPGLPSIEEVSQPELRLAGIRINPRTNGPSRGWYLTGLKLKKMDDGTEYEITGLPAKPHYTDISWAPDGKHIGFVNTDQDGLKLWVINLKDRAARQVSDVPLNGAIGEPFEWLSDSKQFIVLSVLPGRGGAPAEAQVPAGPTIQENIGRKAPARTYQDLLASTHDEAVFDYYTTSQPLRIDLEGNTTPLGQPAVYTGVFPSPDGKLLLAESVHRPYSYTVPYYRFPFKSEVWDLDGNLVYEVADLPLAEEIPIAYGSVRTGRRDIDWRNDADATLHWTEALDGGDAGAEFEFRDQVYTQAAPFDQEPQPLIKLDNRFSNIRWDSDDLAIVSGWWWKTRNLKSWHVKPGKPTEEPRLLVDRSWEDRYNDPGRPMLRRNERGQWVLITADGGKTIFLSGDGASPEGDRPFLDEMNLATHEKQRLFRSEAPYYERTVRLLDPKKRLLLTRRESITEPPNYFVRDLKKDELQQVTTFPHPTPQMKNAQKELIRYMRSDSVEMTATLYLPPGYSPEEDGPLPMLMWAYPQEFKSADAAGQVTDSPYRFIRIAWYSPMVWLAHGYAVLDDPTMPIVGEGDEEPNDRFVEQLVGSAEAAIDEVVKRGVADRNHLAIGGHSYGAFMTANLLAHSDLYQAGIARSGAYNRTLTPFGFQSEERTLWEAPEVYFTMSPFMHADKIDEPILLIHGEADNNSGTYPLQSERFYGALKGHAATVRLVMLPHESHGYRARESIMHMLWEMAEWMDTYVKNAPEEN